MRKNLKVIGEEGEQQFAKWLNEQGVAYIHINNSPETQATCFTGEVKRPDFLVLIPQMGLIAVDVKNYTASNGGFTLGIDNEIRPMIEFEGLFRTYLWYAFKDRASEGATWHFISGYDAAEKGVRRTNTKQGVDFFYIEKEHFKVLKTSDDFGFLFSARIGTTGRITRALERIFTKVTVK